MDVRRDARRLFAIQGYGDNFYTGLTCDGHQVLMGLLCPNLVAYVFSAEGLLLRREVYPWNYPAPRMHGTGPYQIYEATFRTHLAHQFEQWKADIGFRPETIWVQAFFDPDSHLSVAIEEIPEHLLVGEEGEDVEDRMEREGVLKTWIANGNYVLWWGKDYYIGPGGEVEST